jgi:hypothetical protein
MKAFPRPNTIHPDDLGMDLRDYFAAKAMCSTMHTSAILGEDYDPKEIAMDAYIVADAMMKARAEE